MIKTSLIIGLANPGPDYAGTRHNVGGMVVERLARQAGVRFRKRWFRSYVYSCVELGVSPVVVAVPTTYMNLSGIAVKQLVKGFKKEPGEILVVYDDVSLPLGRLRLRKSGTAGGHNGLSSVLEMLETNHVPRLRLGIDSDRRGKDLSSFVLDRFAEDESKELDEVLNRAVHAVNAIIELGFDKAMNQFNKK